MKDQGHSESDKGGAASCIVSLTDNVSAPSNIAYYASRVKEMALRRMILAKASTIRESCYGDNTDSKTILTD